MPARQALDVMSPALCVWGEGRTLGSITGRC